MMMNQWSLGLYPIDKPWEHREHRSTKDGFCVPKLASDVWVTHKCFMPVVYISLYTMNRNSPGVFSKESSPSLLLEKPLTLSMEILCLRCAEHGAHAPSCATSATHAARNAQGDPTELGMSMFFAGKNHEFHISMGLRTGYVLLSEISGCFLDVPFLHRIKQMFANASHDLPWLRGIEGFPAADGFWKWGIYPSNCQVTRREKGWFTLKKWCLLLKISDNPNIWLTVNCFGQTICRIQS